jgi:ATP adenylyltransferase
MTVPLWAPWRMDYVLGPKGTGSCVFCGIAEAPEAERRERLVVCSGPRAYVMLNRYPFTAGHLMVIPHRHVSDPSDLDAAEHGELFELVRASTTRLRAAVKCEGMNVGINLGPAAGAGIAEHLHVHVVPRWSGDTNFMPVLADARVVPQALEKTLAHLEPFFRDLEAGPTSPPRGP